MLPQWHVKDPDHSAKNAGGRLHLNTHTPLTQRVGWLCRCPGIVWEPIRKRAHTQLVREHSGTVVSARWATVDWPWPKEWSLCARANLHFKKEKEKKRRRRGLICRTFSQNPCTRGKLHHTINIIQLYTKEWCLKWNTAQIMKKRLKTP